MPGRDDDVTLPLPLHELARKKALAFVANVPVIVTNAVWPVPKFEGAARESGSSRAR